MPVAVNVGYPKIDSLGTLAGLIVTAPGDTAALPARSLVGTLAGEICLATAGDPTAERSLIPAGLTVYVAETAGEPIASLEGTPTGFAAVTTLTEAAPKRSVVGTLAGESVRPTPGELTASFVPIAAGLTVTAPGVIAGLPAVSFVPIPIGLTVCARSTT